MIREQLKQLSSTPRDLRRFGLVVGGLLLALAIAFAWRRQAYSWCFLAPALPLLGLGLGAPRFLKPVYIAWMGLAFLLGHFVSLLLLTLLFFLVVTPMSWIARALGRDFLDRKFQRQAQSYWRPRDQTKARDYERQF